MKALIVSAVIAIGALSFTHKASAYQQCNTTCTSDGTSCNTQCF